MQGHGGSILYYLPVLLVIAWPHTPLLLKSLGEGWRDRATPLTQFLLLWFATVFILFSLAHTKLPHYLLIGLPPLFLLMAQHRHSLKPSRILWLPWLIMPALVIGLPFIVQYQAQTTSNPYLRALFLQGPDIFTGGWWASVTSMLVLCALLGFVVLRTRPIPADLSARSLALLGATGVMSTLMLTTVLMPVAARLQQTPVRVLAQWARQHPGPIVADDRMPSFAVYGGKPTINRPAHAGDWVFARADHLSDLPPHIVLHTAGGLYLVQILPQ
jgi:4-amino-4-deoxy-L-arabinose transferase-like glycosyltransferase